MKNELKVLTSLTSLFSTATRINEEWIEREVVSQPHVEFSRGINEEWIESSFATNVNDPLYSVSMKNELKDDQPPRSPILAEVRYQWRMNWKGGSAYNTQPSVGMYQWRMNWKLKQLRSSQSTGISRINEEWIERNFMSLGPNLMIFWYQWRMNWKDDYNQLVEAFQRVYQWRMNWKAFPNPLRTSPLRTSSTSLVSMKNELKAKSGGGNPAMTHHLSINEEWIERNLRW